MADRKARKNRRNTATKKAPQARKVMHQEAFLEAYAGCGTITHAAKAAGIGRDAHYRWLKEDFTYAERFDAARAQATDALIREARRRAVDGTEKPVFYQGKQCGVIREYSDNLLMFLIKGEMPEKYRDRHEVITELEPPASEMALTLAEVFSVEELERLKGRFIEKQNSETTH